MQWHGSQAADAAWMMVNKELQLGKRNSLSFLPLLKSSFAVVVQCKWWKEVRQRRGYGSHVVPPGSKNLQDGFLIFLLCLSFKF